MRTSCRRLAVALSGAGLLCLCSGVLSNPDDGSVDYYIRGDANNDARNDISDPVFLLNYLFTGGPAPPCLGVADANDDGRVNIADPIYFLAFLFSGGDPPPPPFPACAEDAQKSACPKAFCNQSS